MVRFGQVRFGRVRFGGVWFGPVRFGMVRCGEELALSIKRAIIIMERIKYPINRITNENPKRYSRRTKSKSGDRKVLSPLPFTTLRYIEGPEVVS